VHWKPDKRNNNDDADDNDNNNDDDSAALPFSFVHMLGVQLILDSRPAPLLLPLLSFFSLSLMCWHQNATSPRDEHLATFMSMAICVQSARTGIVTPKTHKCIRILD